LGSGARRSTNAAAIPISTELQTLSAIAVGIGSPVTRSASTFPMNPDTNQPRHEAGRVLTSTASTTPFASQIEAMRPDCLVMAIPTSDAAKTVSARPQ
jgi:hypothetical protein